MLGVDYIIKAALIGLIALGGLSVGHWGEILAYTRGRLRL